MQKTRILENQKTLNPQNDGSRNMEKKEYGLNYREQDQAFKRQDQEDMLRPGNKDTDVALRLRQTDQDEFFSARYIEEENFLLAILF